MDCTETVSGWFEVRNFHHELAVRQWLGEGLHLTAPHVSRGDAQGGSGQATPAAITSPDVDLSMSSTSTQDRA